MENREIYHTRIDSGNTYFIVNEISDSDGVTFIIEFYALETSDKITITVDDDFVALSVRADDQEFTLIDTSALIWINKSDILNSEIIAGITDSTMTSKVVAKLKKMAAERVNSIVEV